MQPHSSAVPPASFYSWEILYRAMLPELSRRIEEHNGLQQAARGNDPRLLKRSQINTAHNLAKAWCRQAADDVRAGRPVSNAFETNNPESVGRQGCATTAISHRKKLCWAGLLLGERGETPAASMPAQRWRGTRANYVLLLDPALIPRQVLPAGIPVLAMASAEEAFGSLSGAPEGADKVQKLDLSIGKRESGAIKQLAGAASVPAPAAACSSVAGLGREDGAGTGKQEDLAGADDGKRREAPPAPGAAKDRGRGAGAADAFAASLVAMYVALLSRGRAWCAGELERGHAAALRLLAAWMMKLERPAELDVRIWEKMALMAARDHAVSVIDHMAEAMRRNPRLYVLPPSIWLDPASPNGIAGAEARYLARYRSRAGEFEDAAQLRQAADAGRARQDAQAAEAEGGAGRLAWQLKQGLMAIHPDDMRLRGADLAKWAWHLRQLHTRDRYAPEVISKAVAWLTQADGRQAEFWRTQAGGFGIRSAAGLRRAMPQIFDQMNQKPASRNEKAQKSRRVRQ
ncbi:MAG: hypothetical protein NW241_10800 [Bacteroidia bacterium]|nr:hypothetical protein [Bacteroidia bacterium]